MFNKLFACLFAGMIAVAAPSCSSNKIACPTYADSFPEKKAKKQDAPKIPKASKTKSGILPPNAKRVKK